MKNYWVDLAINVYAETNEEAEDNVRKMMKGETRIPSDRFCIVKSTETTPRGDLLEELESIVKECSFKYKEPHHTGDCYPQIVKRIDTDYLEELVKKYRKAGE